MTLPAPNHVHPATCKRVIDGDTFVATVALDYHVAIDITVRIHGVNAPEHNRPGGQEATTYLEQLIGPSGPAGAPPLQLQSYQDARSFERWVCDVDAGGKSVAEAIIGAGHGVPFDPRVDHWTR